jgi:glycerol-3-phosphate acyltransferase PlsY
MAMNQNLSLTLYGLFAYLIAAIPFGVVVSRLVRGQDVRTVGSGNTGATNVSRLMGKKWGVFVLFLDALKGFAVVALAKSLFPSVSRELIEALAVLAVVAHCYPVYLRFKGGKGVATALGVILALSPLLLASLFLCFALVVGTSRMVSLASLFAAAALIPLSFWPGFNLHWQTALALTALIWWKHNENIRRLLRGEEKKFF